MNWPTDWDTEPLIHSFIHRLVAWLLPIEQVSRINITCPTGTSTSPRLLNRTFRDLRWTSCHQICLSKAVAGLPKFTFSYNKGFSWDNAHWVNENKKLHILSCKENQYSICPRLLDGTFLKPCQEFDIIYSLSRLQQVNWSPLRD